MKNFIAAFCIFLIIAATPHLSFLLYMAWGGTIVLDDFYWFTFVVFLIVGILIAMITYPVFPKKKR